MRPITFFEYQPRTYTELGWAPDHPVLEQVEQLNAASKCTLFQVGRHSLRAQQFVGVLRTGGLTMQVLPKIDYAPGGSPDAQLDSPAQQNAAYTATQNLLHLLAYTHDLEIHEQDVAQLLSQRADWFELLTRLFASNLHKLVQQGLEHNYVRIEEDLPVMRGRWLLERQLVRHPLVRHRFDVAYDEFSPDTPLNRVFALVVQQLLLRTTDTGNRRLLADLREWYADVGVGTITPVDLSKVHFTRLNERFRPAFNLARLFIEHLVTQVHVGSAEAFAFVFDMNVLFEEFIARFMIRHRAVVLPPAWNHARLLPQSAGQVYHLATRLPSGREVFRLVPDLLVTSQSGQPVLILDTKYKVLDNGEANGSPAQDDMYQMLAYAMRLRCPFVVVLYPQASGATPLRTAFQVQGYEARLIIATVDLHHPLSQPVQLMAELREIIAPAASLGLQEM